MLLQGWSKSCPTPPLPSLHPTPLRASQKHVPLQQIPPPPLLPSLQTSRPPQEPRLQLQRPRGQREVELVQCRWPGVGQRQGVVGRVGRPQPPLPPCPTQHAPSPCSRGGFGSTVWKAGIMWQGLL